MFSYADYRRYRRYRRWRRRRRLALLLIAITVAAVATQQLAHPRTASHGHPPTARPHPQHAHQARISQLRRPGTAPRPA